jgi:tetratricopeptide (TPR) repeat protein
MREDDAMKWQVVGPICVLTATAAALTACRAAPETGAPGRVPTFNQDVAPIVFERCTPCHRPNQGAPFTLLDYESARSKATKISRAVQTRHMPPWLPEPGPDPFVGERRLTPEQIDVLRRWADAGAPEGPASAHPTAPVFAGGWETGPPDLILTPAMPYVLPAGRGDVYRNLVLRASVPVERYVRAVEFRTGGAPVHHAVIHVDRTSASRRRDGADGEPGFEGMGGREAQDPDGHFLGWAPGRGPIVAPEGMPWVLTPGTDIVVELHLIPGPQRVEVQPTIALFFADAPPARVPLFLKLGSKAIDIPAGAKDYAVDDTFALPVDADLLTLYPHAHYLGKTMQVRATLPDGSTRSLLEIRRWNFRWQQDYQYAAPVALPRGTIITMRFTYDNSADNPDNPNTPPRQVLCGQRSTDEMGNLGLQLVTHSPADRRQLMKAALAHEAQANLAGAEMLVRYNPADAENQRFLGGTYMDVGRTAEALPHLFNAVKLDPRSASAQNELGGALLSLGRTSEAVDRLREATRLAPEDARMTFNLGKALDAAGRRADAATAFERALALNPGLAEAHDELGVLLFARGQITQAIDHLQRAVSLTPESVAAQSDLGGALAQAGRYDAALEHVQRALALDPDYAPARENFARLRQRARR